MRGATDPAAALPRRRLLAGVGLAALAGAGVGALRGLPSGAHDPGPGGAEPAIRAATVWGGGYAGLVGDAYDQVSVHRLRFGEDGRVTPGRPLDVDLPPEFQPWGIAATGEQLWVTGTIGYLFEVVTVDNRADTVPEEFREIAGDGDPELPDEIFDLEVWHYRPALYAVTGDRAEPVDLAVPDEIRWGAATGIVTGDDGTIAVAMDGCPDPDAAVVTRTHLAVSGDGGATWRQRLLDRAGGEGFATSLVTTAGRLHALTVDGAGTRRLRSGILGTEPDLDLVDTVHDAGPVLAAVPDGRGGIKVLTEVGGRVRFDIYRPEAIDRRAAAEPAPCACATTEVVAVNGADDLWMTIAADGARLGN